MLRDSAMAPAKGRSLRDRHAHLESMGAPRGIDPPPPDPRHFGDFLHDIGTERRNALTRAVVFSRLGELRDRTSENQRHRASGVDLIFSEIMLWHTVYIDRAAHRLLERGMDVPDILLAHVAPLR